MPSKNILKSIPPYLAVCAGLFLFHNAWAALLGFHIAILLVLAFSRPIVSPSILFKSKNIKWVIFNILLCGSSGFAIYYLRSFVGLSKDFAPQLAQLGLTVSTFPALIAYFSLINPWIEEYFWRAHLGSNTRGFYFGDLLYAGYHTLVLFSYVPMLMALFAVICLTFIGWFWRQVKRENDGLLAPVLGHVAADFSILMAVYLTIRQS